jgi:hypothetical protein
MKVLATSAIVAVVGLQAWPLAWNLDDWPFASNSMFSFHRDQAEPVYDLVIRVETAGSWRRMEPAADLGYPDGETFRRQFFAAWYGSSDHSFPQRTFSDDDWGRFSTRMTLFCRILAAEMATRTEPPTAMRLSVATLRAAEDRWTVLDEHVVGGCVPIDRDFTKLR